MSDKSIKIKISENKILEVINTPDDSNTFYDDCFEGISLIVNNRKNGYSNKGEFKADSFEAYFDVTIHGIENDDSLQFIAEDGYTFYSVYLYDDSIRIDEKLEHGKLFIESDLPQGFIKFKNNEFGIDDIGLDSWENSVTCLIQGEVYGFKLVEIEKCNLGHDHENDLDSCFGFYGYKNQSELITNIILDHIGIDQVELYDDLENFLNNDDISKLKMSNIIE